MDINISVTSVDEALRIAEQALQVARGKVADESAMAPAAGELIEQRVSDALQTVVRIRDDWRDSDVVRNGRRISMTTWS